MRFVHRSFRRSWAPALAGAALLVAAATIRLPSQTARAQTPPSPSAVQTGPAFTRAQHLRRGINLSMWYAQAGDYSAARLISFTTMEDFQRIQGLGFDHVRLPIDPEPLIAERQSGSLRPDAMSRLDAAVRDLNSLGLAVVLDIHPGPAWVKDVTGSEDGTTRFFNFWRNFARHYATSDPNLVFFEILNEPFDVDWYKWAGIQARAVAVIRSQVPRHTLIATGAQWGKLDALVTTEPVRDDNVLYTFHMYEPYEFTHQGANWMPPGSIYLHGVPYPSSPENVAPFVAAEPDERARLGLERYGLEHWDARRIAGEIGLVLDWAHTRHVPLWCGEFGAYREYAPPAARAQYIGDVRRTFEADGIGWAMWDYQGSFGLVTKTNGQAGGQIGADPAVVQALGLRK